MSEIKQLIIHSFVRSFVRSFTHSIIHSFIHSFIHFIRSVTNDAVMQYKKSHGH